MKRWVPLALVVPGVVLLAFALTGGPGRAARTQTALARPPLRDADLPHARKVSRVAADQPRRQTTVPEYSSIRAARAPAAPVPYHKDASAARVEGEPPPPAGLGPAARIEVASLTPEDIATRARQVEYEAWRRTALLNRDVPLTESQVAQVFRIYARDSKAYHPAIPIEGETPAAATALSEGATPAAATAESTPTEQKVLETLDQGQQVALQQKWVDRDLWWTEIIAQLAEDFPAPVSAAAAAAPAAVDSPAAAAGDAPQPAAHQGDDVLDLLGGGM